jgi:hypothetical protein
MQIVRTKGLRVAHDSGFAVPPTAVTTAPRLARQFTEEHGGVVVKSASGPPAAEPGQIEGRYGDTGHVWEVVSTPVRIGESVRECAALAGLGYAAFDFA